MSWEYVTILLDEFDVSMPKSALTDALHRKWWTEKRTRQKAREPNADLRDDYCHLILEFC